MKSGQVLNIWGEIISFKSYRVNKHHNIFFFLNILISFQYLSIILSTLYFQNIGNEKEDPGVFIIRKTAIILSFIFTNDESIQEFKLFIDILTYFFAFFAIFVHAIIFGYFLLQKFLRARSEFIISLISIYTWIYPHFLYILVQNKSLTVLFESWNDAVWGNSTRFLLTLTLVSFIEGILCIQFLNGNITSRSLIVSKSKNYALAEYIMKSILSVIIIFYQHNNNHRGSFWVALCFSAFLLCFLALIEVWRFEKISKVRLYINSSAFTIVLISAISKFFIENLGLGYTLWPFYLVSLSMVGKIVINFVERNRMHQILSLKNLKSPEEALKFYLLFRDLVYSIEFCLPGAGRFDRLHIDNLGLLQILNAFIQDGTTRSKESLARFENYFKFDQNWSDDSKSQIVNFLLDKIYSKFKTPEISLVLLEHNIAKKKYKKIPIIFSIVYKLSKMNLTWYQRVSFNFLKQKTEILINNYMKELEASKNFLPIELALQNENNYQKIFTLIELEIKHRTEFWIEMLNEKISPTLIQNIANNINDVSNKIKNLWNEFSNTSNPKEPHFYILYGLYLTFIKMNVHEGYKNLSTGKHKILESNKIWETQDSIFDKNNLISRYGALIRVSGEPGSIGKIDFCSNGIKLLAGYDANRLIGDSINSLMITSIAMNHDHYIDRFVKRGYSNQFGVLSYSFCLHKNGYSVPVLLNFKLYPYSETGISFVGAIKLIKNYGDFFLLDKSGRIEGFSKDILKKLSSPNTSKFSNISDIFVNFDIEVKNELSRLFSGMCFINFFETYSLEIIEKLACSKRSDIRIILKESKVKLRTKYLSNLCAEFEINVETIGDTRLFVLKFKNLINSSQIISLPSEIALESNVPIIKPYESLHKSMMSNVGNSFFSAKKIYNSDFHIQYKDIANQEETPLTEIEEKSQSESKEISNIKYVTSNKKKDDKHEEIFAAKSSSSKSSKKKYERISNSFEEPYLPTSIFLLKFGLIFYFILSIIFILVLEYWTISLINDTENVLEVMIISQSRQEQISEVNRRARITKVILDGEISRSRHEYLNISDYLPYNLERIGVQSLLLSVYNDQFRGRISDLSSSIQSRIFEKNIPIKYETIFGDSNEIENMRNSFDAAGEIALNGLKYSKKPLSNLKYSDAELNFLLQNTLNQALMECIQTTQILDDYIIEIMDEYTNRSIVIIALIIVGGVLILGGSISYSTIEFKEKLISFFEALSKFSQEEIEKILGNIKCISQYLQNQKREYLDEEELYRQLSLVKAKGEEKKIAFKLKKSFKNEEILVAPIKDAVLSFAIVVLFALLMSSILIVSLKYKKNTLSLANRLRFTYQDLTYLDLAFSGVYEYINENRTTTIFTVPIETIIDEILSKIGNVEESNKMYSGGEKNSNSEYSNVLEGDLCKYLPARFVGYCFLDYRLTRNGILGLKPFYSESLNRAKSAYQFSNHTKEAQIEAFAQENLKIVERMFYFYTRGAYITFQNILKDDVVFCLEDFREKSLITSALICFIFILVSLLTWKPVILKVINRYNRLKKVAMPIPIKNLMTNKMLLLILAKLSPMSLGKSFKLEF